MNYLKSIVGALPASVFPLRGRPAALPLPATLSRTELKRIVAEALG